MNSINFEMLRDQSPELATLGGFAEQYAYKDPSSALIKLRTLTEHIVEGIYYSNGISIPFQSNLFDLLQEETFKEAIPGVVLDKIHQIRIDGNKAAHGQPSESKTALGSLRDAWDLSRWYYLSYKGGQPEDCKHYEEPSPEDKKSTSKRKKVKLLEKLSSQEVQLQELLQQVETLRGQAKKAKKPRKNLNLLEELV